MFSVVAFTRIVLKYFFLQLFPSPAQLFLFFIINFNLKEIYVKKRKEIKTVELITVVIVTAVSLNIIKIQKYNKKDK